MSQWQAEKAERNRGSLVRLCAGRYLLSFDQPFSPARSASRPRRRGSRSNLLAPRLEATLSRTDPSRSYPRRPSFMLGFEPEKASHGASHACARRFESESVERDEASAPKPRTEVSSGKDERDGNAPHPTP